MTAIEYIRQYEANFPSPSLRWDGKENIDEWQKRARAKLCSLLGLQRLVPAEKDLIIEYDVETEDFREIRFRFQSEPGYYVPCHLLIPNGLPLPLPTFICLQGHSTGMHISLGRTKFPRDMIVGDRDFCIRCVKEGFCAVALEQRNFGECGGTPEGPACRTEPMANLLVGRTTIGERVWDVMHCADLLLSDFSDFVDPDKLYLMGNSGGGTATVYAGAIDTRFSGCIPSCAVTTYFSSIGTMLHCECNYIPNIAEFFDMGDLLGLIAPRKLVVVNGEMDKSFPIKGAKECVEYGRKVYSALGSDNRIVHCIGPEGHRFYADLAWEAFKKML